eukprot:TRINITY_DN76731_c0_g1_i1.p1 TRINITY_DN76731_c0_g1~~TRINITY_DN76731_c0_g1_i1.p1  ORF type:complete len:387 (-),score=62.51 TRINITY_DN76731_c0_g1_i1:140-1300(-)
MSTLRSLQPVSGLHLRFRVAGGSSEWLSHRLFGYTGRQARLFRSSAFSTRSHSPVFIPTVNFGRSGLSVNVGCNRRLAASAADAAKKKNVRAIVRGYWGPRIAVFAATTTGSVALYELISTYLASQEDVFFEWDDSWDDIELLEAAAEKTASGGNVTPVEASLAAAWRLRQAADGSGQRRRVGRRQVVFVRHAQAASANTAESTSVLSDIGMRQARLTGERLRAVFDEAKVGNGAVIVFHSGEPETKATAEAIHGFLAKPCKLTGTALLAEGLPVLPSPASSGVVEAFEEANADAELARAEGAFRAHIWQPTGELPERVNVEVIVSHGNLLRYLTCRSLQLPPSAWSRLRAHNCALTRLDIDSDGFVYLHEFGSIGHLPLELVTYN